MRALSATAHSLQSRIYEHRSFAAVRLAGMGRFRRPDAVRVHSHSEQIGSLRPAMGRARAHGSGGAAHENLVRGARIAWNDGGDRASPQSHPDRKSTRLNSSHVKNLVCRLLLEKKNKK